MTYVADATKQSAETRRTAETQELRHNKYNKNIRFSLVLKDDKEVRSLEELRQHFDIEDLVERCIEKDNRLIGWLEDRYYEREKKRVTELKEEYERRHLTTQANMQSDRGNLQWLARELYDTFQIPIDENSIRNLDDKRIKESRDKEDELKEVIRDDDLYLLKFKQRMARNQNELDAIVVELKKLGRRNAVIYLVSQGETPYVIEKKDVEDGMRYIGIETEKENGNLILVKITSGGDSLARDQVGQLLKVYRNAFANLKICPSDDDTLMDIPDRKRINKTNMTSFDTVKEKLVHYVDAGLPLIYLNTFEEDKADELIDAVRFGKRILEWGSEGFFTKTSGRHDWSLKGTLKILIDNYLVHSLNNKANPSSPSKKRYDLCRSIFVIKDAHNLLKDDEIISRLKFISQLIYNGQIEDCNIIIVSSILTVPPELEKYMTIVKLADLTDDEIAETLENFCLGQNVDMPKEVLQKKLIRALRGMSEFDILNILSLAILDDRELKSSDTELILEHKQQLIEKTSILELVDVDEDEDDIGGLEELKKWLKSKKKIFADIDKAEKFGVDIPKGVMIAGMPGCGKSMTAKATSAIFDMPLLKMDMGRIMGKYVGESEKNMRRALHLSETIAPCVLWIDEIEKAFAGTGNDGGSEVTMRLLGTFLTWMQEKKSIVFVVATANDAMRLPPELLRRGRFDEIFYVGLPNASERKESFRIHIARRRFKDLQWLEPDIDQLVKRTKNYSGADIEGIVREAVETAFCQGDKVLAPKHLNQTIDQFPSKTKMSSKARRLLQSYVQSNFRAASAKENRSFGLSQIKDVLGEKLKYCRDYITRGTIYQKRRKINKTKLVLEEIFSPKGADGS